MKIGYARVSTKDQSLDLQTDALKKAGAEKIFYEKMSGMKDGRPELEKLLEFARTGDSLIVWKMDRLGRSLKSMLELAESLEKQGIELVSIQDQIDTSSAVGKAMFRMLLVLAEMERDIIAERTQAGLAAARSRGRHGGRPRKSPAKVETAIKLYESKSYTLKQIEEMSQISKATLYRELKKRNST